jgi:hypothetical protein
MAYAPSPGVVNIGSYPSDSQPIQDPSGVALNVAFKVLSTLPSGRWALTLADFDRAGFSYESGFIVAALPGDANLDGTVNGADLNTVLSNFNQIGMGWRQGDFNYDGTVNGADLNTLLSNFNQHSSVGAAVPEPSTVLLAAAGLLGVLAYGWRKRK